MMFLPTWWLRCWALKCVYDSLKEILWVHKFEEFGDTRGQGFIYRWAFSQVRFCSPFFLITGARLHPGLLESLPWPSILNITRIFSTNTSMSKKDFLNTWLDLITYLSSLSLSLVFWNKKKKKDSYNKNSQEFRIEKCKGKYHRNEGSCSGDLEYSAQLSCL